MLAQAASANGVSHSLACFWASQPQDLISWSYLVGLARANQWAVCWFKHGASLAVGWAAQEALRLDCNSKLVMNSMKISKLNYRFFFTFFWSIKTYNWGPGYAKPVHRAVLESAWLCTLGNDQEFWKLQRLGRNPAFVSSPFTIGWWNNYTGLALQELAQMWEMSSCLFSKAAIFFLGIQVSAIFHLVWQIKLLFNALHSPCNDWKHMESIKHLVQVLPIAGGRGGLTCHCHHQCCPSGSEII